MRKSATTSLPSLSVRIDLDEVGRIGPGKIQLLEQIQSHGSISAAGRAMNMSYKRAWDLVDEINRICRRSAVERQRAARTAVALFSRPSVCHWWRVTEKSNARPKAPRARSFVHYGRRWARDERPERVPEPRLSSAASIADTTTI